MSLAGLLDDFLVRAALAGLVGTLAAAPSGCFVVGRRMALLRPRHRARGGAGVVLVLSAPVLAGVLATALAMASALSAPGGLAAAHALGTPAGPSIVCTAPPPAFAVASMAGVPRGS